MSATFLESAGDLVVSREFQINQDLSDWLEQEAATMGITPSMLVGSLLEWARNENITRDEDLAVFS